jgi:hypothetical protein
MRASVRALAKRGVKEYPVTPRAEWVLQNPAQLVIVVSQIYWCQVGGWYTGIPSIMSHSQPSD